MLGGEQYGWRMEYFVGNEDGDFGGINVALKFDNEKGEVTAMSEEEKEGAYTSLYVLTTDSGPMHMACALRTPTVAVFSTGNWRQWAPKKNCHLVTLDLSCSPCEKETAEICQTQQCIRDITMDMLIEKLDVCMKSSG